MVVGVLGVVTSCVLCARVSRVLRDVLLTTGCISCATENTYTPALSRHHSQSFVPFVFAAGFGLFPTRHLVRDVLHLVR